MAKRVFIIIFVPLSERYSGRAPLSSNKRQQARRFVPKHCKLALTIYVIGRKVENGSFTSTPENQLLSQNENGFRIGATTSPSHVQFLSYPDVLR